MKEKADEIQLQVLICTFGRDGIERVASGQHPEVPGVEYLVSWQASDGIDIPGTLMRHDFTIHRTDTTGLSKNRNHALAKASAPLLLISDDDVDYTAEGLMGIISSFEANPDADLLVFRFDCNKGTKFYPDHSFSLRQPPKGYYTSSIEIALRRNSLAKHNIWFNENFGIGAIFPSGEEDILIKDCMDARLTGRFIPLTIARHDADTTSHKNLSLPSRPQTRGAIFLHLHPKSWPVRMIVHAIREIPLWRKGEVPSPLSFCRNWIKGVRMAKRHHVFPTPDYSSKYEP